MPDASRDGLVQRLRAYAAELPRIHAGDVREAASILEEAGSRLSSPDLCEHGKPVQECEWLSSPEGTRGDSEKLVGHLEEIWNELTFKQRSDLMDRGRGLDPLIRALRSSPSSAPAATPADTGVVDLPHVSMPPKVVWFKGMEFINASSRAITIEPEGNRITIRASPEEER